MLWTLKFNLFSFPIIMNNSSFFILIFYIPCCIYIFNQLMSFQLNSVLSVPIEIIYTYILIYINILNLNNCIELYA